MAITQAMCTSFKKELLEGIHNFKNSGGDTFKIALYTSSATLSAATTAYTTTNEVANGNGYSTGGNTLTRVDPTSSGTTGFTDFSDSTWSSSTITARGALIYNSSDSNKAVAALDFGEDKSSSGGDFTIQFPAASASAAIIRIS
jgi:VCBS repeat-containing protein